MGWTAPPTFAAGDQFTAADWNAWVQDNLHVLHGVSAVRISHSTTTASVATQSFDTVQTDSDADGHQSVGGGQEVTIRTPGLWSIAVCLSDESNNATNIDVRVRLNSGGDSNPTSSTRQYGANAATSVPSPNLHFLWPLRAGDELSVYVGASGWESTAADPWAPVIAAVRLSAIWPAVGGDDPDVIAGA